MSSLVDKEVEDLNENDAMFCSMVLYFWEEKEDPTRFSDWDNERCRKLMPNWHRHWLAFVHSKELISLITKENKGYLP